MADTPARGLAHLIGSVPLATAEEVFRTLRMPPPAQLYLGLIHHADDAGDRRRIATARTVMSRFGVATECGWGRTDPARVSGLLDSHRRAVESLTSAG